eukprot:EC690460.1.p1 GENE.EC690460.1~~EC690460.1.p1  ORF type:complete len:140 (-),score=16.07 EC690460.1:207-626(-)
MQDPGSPGSTRIRAGASKAPVVMMIRNMEVWIIEYMGDKDPKDEYFFAKVVSLLENFFFPPFPLRSSFSHMVNAQEMEKFKLEHQRVAETNLSMEIASSPPPPNPVPPPPPPAPSSGPSGPHLPLPGPSLPGAFSFSRF